VLVQVTVQVVLDLIDDRFADDDLIALPQHGPTAALVGADAGIRVKQQ
jgi:hypothetical protein